MEVSMYTVAIDYQLSSLNAQDQLPGRLEGL